MGFRGLSQSELNGEVGTVDSVDYSDCRYLIKMWSGHIKSVKGVVDRVKKLPKVSSFLHFIHEACGVYPDGCTCMMKWR